MRFRHASLVIGLAGVHSACGGSAPKSETPVARSVVAEQAPAATGGEVVLAAEADSASSEEGSSSAGPAPAAPPSPQTVATGGGQVPVLKEQLVVEAWLSVEVEDAAATTRALHTLVEQSQGRVVSEQVSGAAESWSASIQLRLPPRAVNSVIDWLGQQGEVTSKRIQGTDVSKTLFDQEIALQNLTLTLERLRKLLDAGGLQMKDILEVEKEMTRLRGEIERIKGEKRWLEDRVSLATVSVELRRRHGAVLSPKAKVYPGPRLSLLTLFDAGGRKQNRVGGGVAMHIVVPRITLQLDVFDDVDATSEHPRESHAVLATYGAAMYSDFLGRGEREFLNPFIGFRAGYGWLDYHAFVLQGEIGLELYKQEHMLIDASVQATGFLGEDNVDAGLVSGASAVFAF